MNIIGEYTLKYSIYTMFDVYNVEIKNHNLITNAGYEFFMSKWCEYDVLCPVELGYYSDGKFYSRKNIDDTYSNQIGNTTGLKYIDKNTYREYLYDGEKFVEFSEKLEKICLGKYNYLDDERSKPDEYDTELYNPSKESLVDSDGFIFKNKSLILKCTFNKEDLDNTTEIGVKTNHGRLVSHDIHAPYSLPLGNEIIIEYVFKLGE